MDAGELAGKVALITGAGRGFGRAIAELFAEQGADLALNYRGSREGCEAVAEQARAHGRRALAVRADLTDGAAVAAMVERVLAELGRIDILVNNAGAIVRKTFLASTEADWRGEMEVNVFGALRVTRAVVPGMIARRSGTIVNLSSPVALTGRDDGAVYAGSKAFLLSWTKSLARELGPYGITVNAIAPSAIVTDMNASLYPDEATLARKAGTLPLRRMGDVRDCAETALFLASARGSFLTGQLLSPSGGSLMP